MTSERNIPSATARTPGAAPARAHRRGEQHVLRVERREQLAPGMVRLHLGGDGCVRFLAAADPVKLATTDKYVKLLIPHPGLPLSPPYDFAALRAAHPAEHLPSRRTYTVRSVDAVAGTIAIDFVVHGAAGFAGPWAAAARPGDLLAVSGPGGGFSPVADSGVYRLFIGDEAALPALAATLEQLPQEAVGLALIEVGSAAEELPLAAPPGVSIEWLHRDAGGREHGIPMADAVAALTPHPGPVEVFAHGERGAIARIRTLLGDEWGLSRGEMSISPYWALGRAEDAFQAEKRSQR